MTSPDDIGAIGVRTPSYSIFIPQDLHMVELEDFKYGGTNITALRLVDPSNEKVRISSFYSFLLYLFYSKSTVCFNINLKMTNKTFRYNSY